MEPLNITPYDKDPYIIKDVAIVRFSWIICVGPKYNHRNFPGGPVTKIPHFQHRGPVSIHMSKRSQLKIPDAATRPRAAKQINSKRNVTKFTNVLISRRLHYKRS